jgi:molybdopterin-guanine dinucleotide biosynthesis protein A
MVDLRNVTLAILAGGAGTRMGFPKAWLQLLGRPILQYLHESLLWPGPTMLVTVPNRRRPPGFELFQSEVVDPAEEGPLGGVLTAMQHSLTPQTLVIPVDMPQLRVEHLQWFADSLEAHKTLLGIMARRTVDGADYIEPLPLCCRPNAREVIAGQIRDGGYSVRILSRHPLFAAEPVPSHWPAQVWTNLNYPDDLQKQ